MLFFFLCCWIEFSWLCIVNVMGEDRLVLVVVCELVVLYYE